MPGVQPPQGRLGSRYDDLTADFTALATPSDRLEPRRAIFRPSVTVPTDCVVDPYHPSPALAKIAERRRATWYAAMIGAACEAGLPINLFDAMIIAESQYNPAALSPKGAAGLAQLMPESARHLGVGNVWDPNANLRGGAHLLRALLDEFGRFDLALAAYNAGAVRVRATRQVPRIPETIHYVSKILTTMRDQLLSRRIELPKARVTARLSNRR